MATKTSDEIRAEVSKRYGGRVAGTLSAEDAVPMSQDACCEGAEPTAAEPCCDTAASNTSDEACCGTDTGGGDACCGTDAGSEEQVSKVAELFYEGAADGLPGSVTDVAFGCGNPTAIDALQPGERVLDLGSGGGIDCFLSAKAVGERGHVIGVDMTPEMVALARKNAGKVGASNVEFRLGEIEQLPVETGTVDVIISNCVINLSPEKERVFAEAFRVLAPGGRLQVSDLVWRAEPDPSIREDMEAWAGCIAGALEVEEYLGLIRAAGFEDVRAELSEYGEREGIASAAVTGVKRA